MSSENTKDKSENLNLPASPDRRKRNVLLLAISLTGLLVALLSGFREDIPFLKSVCTSACSDAAEIHFLGMPLWLLGALFYLTAAVLALFEAGLVTWIVAPAVGTEAVLIWIMIQLKMPCGFCLANAAVMLLLFAAAFKKRLFWQEATLALLFLVGSLFWIPSENSLSHVVPLSTGHGASALHSDEEGVAAKIGDQVITNERLEVLLGPKLLETRTDIYRMKKDKLDDLIIEKIFETEAKQQGKTPENLADQIAPPESFQVGDDEIDKYMQEHQGQFQEFRGSLDELKQRLRSFLEQQKRSQVIREYAHSLEPKYGVQILLPVPHLPVVKVDTKGAPTLGPPEAPVTIIEFSDYECPACRATHMVIKQVMAAYGDKVHWVFKDDPLRRHKDAFKAAEASHCAQDEGKYQEYRERLFTAPDLAPANLVDIAVQLGMSREKFSRCLEDSTYKATVEKNIEDAVGTGVDRTPSFLINGVMSAGAQSFDKFKGLIDEELKKSAMQMQAVQKHQ